MTFYEIYASLANETILEDLETRYPGETDFSLFTADSEQRAPLLKILRESGEGFEGRERKKLGFEDCGLNLLMAVVLESIQRKV